MVLSLPPAIGDSPRRAIYFPYKEGVPLTLHELNNGLIWSTHEKTHFAKYFNLLDSFIPKEKFSPTKQIVSAAFQSYMRVQGIVSDWIFLIVENSCGQGLYPGTLDAG